MIPLSHLSVLEFRGSDAGQFLHNQLSADILATEPGEAVFACCCNPSGRVLGLVLVRPGPDSCLAVCAKSLAGVLATWLDKFILRADVVISTRNDLVVAGTTGPDNGEYLFRNVTGMRYTVAKADDLKTGADDSRAGSWKAMEMQAGIAWLHPATSGRFLPQMLGCKAIGALSFNKGCYPGQEVIARTRYLGNLKRHPLRCRVAGAISPAPMEAITLTGGDGEASAVVVDHAPLDDGATLLFLVARIDGEFSPSTVVWSDREFAVNPWDPAQG
jgi:folate-binding protein YgfZ